VPASTPSEGVPPGMVLHRVRTLDEALTSTLPLWSTVAATR